MEYIVTAVCTTHLSTLNNKQNTEERRDRAHSPSDRTRPRRVLVDPRDNPEQHEISVQEKYDRHRGDLAQPDRLDLGRESLDVVVQPQCCSRCSLSCQVEGVSWTERTSCRYVHAEPESNLCRTVFNLKTSVKRALLFCRGLGTHVVIESRVASCPRARVRMSGDERKGEWFRVRQSLNPKVEHAEAPLELLGQVSQLKGWRCQ